MGRDRVIAHSIASAITKKTKDKRSRLGRKLAALTAFFSFFDLPLHEIDPDHFAGLRREHWELTDDDYVASFKDGDGKLGETLHSIGDMGFSGSTFYATDDQRFLVKSVPRPSEYSFFRDDLLEPYVAYMAAHPKSLLVRICDFLGSRPAHALGAVLGLAPSHHIVMDNVMYGQELAARRGGAQTEWQHWDLKPTSYFYPERDLAAGLLATEATLSKLADEFDGHIGLTREHADDLLAALEADTRLLAQHNAVDYSLFLVRIAAHGGNEGAGNEDNGNGESNGNNSSNPFTAAEAPDAVPVAPPVVPPAPPSWRTGVPSRDGRYLFRAAVLDFFWAKHKMQPRLMTLLISAWNLLTRQGHMSITTTPEEYRERFLKMCRDIVVVEEDGASAEPDGDEAEATSLGGREAEGVSV